MSAPARPDQNDTLEAWTALGERLQALKPGRFSEALESVRGLVAAAELFAPIDALPEPVSEETFSWPGSASQSA